MRRGRRDWRVPLLVVGSFLFARMTGGRLPYFLFYVTALVWAVGWLWTRLGSRNLQCTIQVARERVEVGEEFGVRIRLENEGLLPLPWVEVDDQTPGYLVSTDRRRHGTAVPALSSRLIDLTLTARRRGHYQVGPVVVRLGDGMGLFQKERALHSRAYVTVLPRVHPIESLPIPLSQPFGPVRTRQRAFEDPSNHGEILPYVPGDNPKHIHWKTSARMGELMTRHHELSASTQIMIFPDLNQAVQVGRAELEEPSTEETAVEIAASLAALGLRRKIETGLVCHGQERFSVGPGRGQRTYTEMLEVLARARAEGQIPLEQVLERAAAHLGSRSTLAVITPALTGPLADMLLRLRTRHEVMLFLLEAGDESAESTDSLASLLILRRIWVYRVPLGADLRLLAEMRLTTSGEGVRRWNSAGRPAAIR